MWRIREPKIRLPTTERIEKANTRRIATELEAEMEREIYDGFDSLSDDTITRQLRDGFEQRDSRKIDAAIPWAVFLGALSVAYLTMARKAVQRSTKAAANELGRTLGFTLAFDALNPRAVDWINLHAAQMVREVGEQTKLAVGEIIRRAFEEGMHPYTAAKHIQRIVGLTVRQGIAVDNYYRNLLREGRYPQSVIDRYVERYAKRMQRYRARVLSRTETINASNAGQQMLWEDAAARGLLPANTRRQWLATLDDRTCELCAELHGQTVGLYEPFVASDGTTVMHPTLHPACRCSVGLVFPEGGGR